MMFALAFIHRFEAGTRPGETPLLLLHGSDHFRLRTIALVERSNHRSAKRIAQMITRFVATDGGFGNIRHSIRPRSRPSDGVF
jgi:hypothetical protein